MRSWLDNDCQDRGGQRQYGQLSIGGRFTRMLAGRDDRIKPRRDGMDRHLTQPLDYDSVWSLSAAADER